MLLALFLLGVVTCNVFADISDQCPAVDGPDAVYFPHETDCSKFYECSNGVAYLFDCPPGLDFNPNLNVCDYPDQAGCRGRTTAPPTPPITETTTSSQAPPVETTTAAPNPPITETTTSTQAPPVTETPTAPPTPPVAETTTSSPAPPVTETTTASPTEGSSPEPSESTSSQPTTDDGDSSDDSSDDDDDSSSSSDSDDSSDSQSDDDDDDDDDDSSSSSDSDDSSNSQSDDDDDDDDDSNEDDSNGSNSSRQSGDDDSDFLKLISGVLEIDPLQGKACSSHGHIGSLTSYPGSCKKYQKCYNGVTLVKKCVKKYNFDEKIGICVVPGYTECGPQL